MALTYLIFRRSQFWRRSQDGSSWDWLYTYLRTVRWSGGIIELQRSVQRTNPKAVVMTPEEANLKFPNCGDWRGDIGRPVISVTYKTADDMGPGETFRHDAAPRCELCGRQMEREEIGPGPNEWDWICPKEGVHG